MRPRMRLITVTVQMVNGEPTLVQAPLDSAAADEIHGIRNDIMRRNDLPLAMHLTTAFQHSVQVHPGENEPLLILSRKAGDFIVWHVNNADGTPISDFEVEVQPFPGQGAAGTPSAFANFGPGIKVPSIGGVVSSGIPTAAAVNATFRWHKFTVSIPSSTIRPLDPCIFVDI